MDQEDGNIPLDQLAALQRPEYIKPKKAVEEEVEEEATEAELVKLLRDLKDTKKEIEARLKEANKDIEDTVLKLYDLMTARGIDMFRIKGVGTASRGTEPRVSVVPGQLENFISYLDEQEEGAIAKRSIHPSTLKAWAKERLENNLDLPTFLKVFHQPKINFRKG